MLIFKVPAQNVGTPIRSNNHKTLKDKSQVAESALGNAYRNPEFIHAELSLKLNISHQQLLSYSYF